MLSVPDSYGNVEVPRLSLFCNYYKFQLSTPNSNWEQETYLISSTSNKIRNYGLELNILTYNLEFSLTIRNSKLQVEMPT